MAQQQQPLRPEPRRQPEPPRAGGLTEPAPQIQIPTAERRVIGPLEAGLRHPLLVTLPIVLLAGAALALGLARHPTYTAQSNINVGRVDVPAYTLQGVVAGNVTLAASYAEAGDAPAVLQPAARVAGVSQGEARSRLNVSPVVGTTLLRVEASGPTKRSAVILSNAAAAALITYVQKLNNAQVVTGLLPQYRSALAQIARTRALLARLDASKHPDQSAIQQAKLDLATAQLQAQSLSGEYVNQGASASPNDLQLTTPAVIASSDFSSVLQRLILAGLAAGLVVGLVLALLRANARLMSRARRLD